MATFTVRRFRRVTEIQVTDFEVTASDWRAACAASNETDDSDLEWVSVDRQVEPQGEEVSPITPAQAGEVQDV